MTPLTKRVKRASTGLGVNRRPFVVILEAPDLIGFRDRRSRRVWWTTLAACYALAIRQAVAAEKAERAAKKKAARR